MTPLGQQSDKLSLLAPTGFYIALRVGFTFPEEELNRLPDAWVDHYTRYGLVVQDPLMKWVYSNTGAQRWSDIQLPDPAGVQESAAEFGMYHGAAASILTKADQGRRSYGLFFRGDRDFLDAELAALEVILDSLHSGAKMERALTANEVEALKMLASGLRLQQIADRLGISESAVKARLNNAKAKLGARTASQAASLAASKRLL